MKLKYPVLVCFDHSLTVANQNTLHRVQRMQLPGQLMACPEGVDPKKRYQWLIERDGTLLLFAFSGTRNKWARKIKFLRNHVLAVYRCEAVHQPQIKMILPLLDGISDAVSPTGRDFKTYLEGLPETERLTEERMLDWLQQLL